MKKINRRSFLAAAGLTAAALALTACGGSASSTASSTASSAASSEAASTSAAAELTTVEAGKLTMATNAAFPPYEMTTDAGEFEGIDIDTAKAIAEKLGLELQIDDMDFDAALLSVQQGKADIVMAGVTVTDERKAVMDFSDSYATGIQSIIVPEGSDITSPDDLAGKKIGTQRGTTFRLRGKGIQYLNGRGRGDMYVKCEVEIPKKLHKAQRDALKKFEGTLKEENYEKRKGFFKKLKDMFA